MKDIGAVTCCVIDHGLFRGLAHRLAQGYKRVLYWTPAERDFPVLPEHVLGDGFPDIERCLDFWEAKDEIDLFVFPDIQHAGLQKELIRQGFPVWGARGNDWLEINREKFHQTLANVGLEVAPFEVVVGLTALREHLRDKQDKYLKVSKFRGSFETFHWRNWLEDSGALDVWAVHFGPLQDLVRFLVCDDIPTDLEIGGDTYCIDGRFPKRMLHGLEAKDKGYLGVMTDTADMPEQIKAVMEAFAPLLAEGAGFRNLWSMEVRVQEDKFYFTDPCCRASSPGTLSRLLLYRNFPEIIWAGAQGELLEPVTEEEYAVECGLTAKGEKEAWRVVEFPPELQGQVATRGACCLEGAICLPPHEAFGDEIGYLGATGNSFEEVTRRMDELTDQLPDGVSANTQSLYDLLEEAHSAEEQGVPISDDVIPEPATALEKA